EQRRALVGVPLDLDHDPLRVLAGDPQRGLVREELDRVDGPGVARRELGRSRAAELHHDQPLGLARLGDLERPGAHPLDQPAHEGSNLPERRRRRADRGGCRRRRRRGLLRHRLAARTIPPPALAAPAALPLAALGPTAPLTTVAFAAARLALPARAAPAVVRLGTA